MNPSLLFLQGKMEDMLLLETMQNEKSLVKETLVLTHLLIENVLLVDSLKHNLLSNNQLCDKGFKVIFEASHCIFKDIQNDKTIFIGYRCDNVYTINISKYDGHDKCFSSMHDQIWLCHRRLRHANMDLISQLNKNELVRCLPKINFQKDKFCETCQVGKQIKNSFKKQKLHFHN